MMCSTLKRKKPAAGEARTWVYNGDDEMENRAELGDMIADSSDSYLDLETLEWTLNKRDKITKRKLADRIANLYINVEIHHDVFYVYVCMYVCMYGWMDGWMDGCMYVCMYARMCVCVQHVG